MFHIYAEGRLGFMDKHLTVQQYLKNPNVNSRIEELLKERSGEFIMSLTSMVSQNTLLAKCEPGSLVMAALTATAMRLPINQNLGFAFIIPYRQKDGSYVAQLQLGYKAFIQLSQRSGQFSTINVTDVKEGEIEKIDRLSGEIKFNWIETDRLKAKTIGYVGYIRLLNGFEKSMYMTVEELKAHGLKYSQTFKKGFGLWEDNFDAMAAKTIIKLLLSKYAPLSTEMQKAQLSDQAIIKEDGQMEYVDNEKLLPEEINADKERERIRTHIKESKTIDDLVQCFDHITDEETKNLYAEKEKELNKEVTK